MTLTLKKDSEITKDERKDTIDWVLRYNFERVAKKQSHKIERAAQNGETYTFALHAPKLPMNSIGNVFKNAAVGLFNFFIPITGALNTLDYDVTDSDAFKEFRQDMMKKGYEIDSAAINRCMAADDMVVIQFAKRTGGLKPDTLGMKP